MNHEKFLENKFSYLGQNFLEEIKQKSLIADIKSKTEIMVPGQRIKYIPFLLEGLIKVYNLNDGRELLYYYIKPGESCIMTISSVFQNPISRIYVFAEEQAKVVLIPIDVFLEFTVKYPLLNNLIYKEFDTRYTELISVTNDAIFNKLDTRILNFVQKHAEITGKSLVTLSHKEIAINLGTAREVVSRVIKKLVGEGHLSQQKNGIVILKNINIQK